MKLFDTDGDDGLMGEMEVGGRCGGEDVVVGLKGRTKLSGVAGVDLAESRPR